MVVTFDPNRKNYTNEDVIIIPNNTVMRNCNFTQRLAWTEPFGSATGLVFEDCNITNCLLPADSVVRTAGNTKTMRSLPDGRKYKNHRRWSVVSRSSEAEPGLFESRDIEQTIEVVGTPQSPIDGRIIHEKDLGRSVP